jgi:hypothetical protein
LPQSSTGSTLQFLLTATVQKLQATFSPDPLFDSVRTPHFLLHHHKSSRLW